VEGKVINRRLLVVASLAVFAVFLIGPASQPAETSAAAQKGRIEGSVVTAQPHPDGTPLEGWRVLLGTNECKLVSSTTTDAHGVYRFPNLEPGNYAVELAFDQPYGQGWLPLSYEWTGGGCGNGISVVDVSAGSKAEGPDFKVDLIEDPRGYFGKVFYDANENGARDADETGFLTSMTEANLDMLGQFPTDMEGSFRRIERMPPTQSNLDRLLTATTCLAYPSLPTSSAVGYRITTPAPNSCGAWGCLTKIASQLFRCQDFGLYQVDPNPAYFTGEVWVNATPAAAGAKVIAWMGDVACGEGYATGGNQPSWYSVIVRSSATRAGCGTEGAAVRFTIDDQPVTPTGVWHVRTMQQIQQRLDLVAGPPIAVYDIDIMSEGPPQRTVQAFIDDTLCAEGTASRPVVILSATPQSLAVSARLILVVPSESLRPGCGREGATVRFVVDGVTYSPTAVWTPGEQRLQLMAGPVVKPPPTGSGGYLPQ